MRRSRPLAAGSRFRRGTVQQLQRPASQRSAAHQPAAADASTLTGKLSSAGPLARKAALAAAAIIRAARPGPTGPLVPVPPGRAVPAVSSSGSKITHSSPVRASERSASRDRIRAETFFLPLQPFRACPQSVLSSEGNERETGRQMRKRLRCVIAGGIFFLLAVSAGYAQQSPDETKDSSLPSAPKPADGSTPDDQTKPAAAPAKSAPAVPPVQHRFWDRENDWLFGAVGAGRALDYASTLNLRHRGIDEAFLTNSVVDNHPLFAGIEVAATAASVGVSYIFHRTHHHRLERWISAIHAGIAVGGAIRNYNLKSPHPG